MTNELPVGHSVWNYWKAQNGAALDEAAEVIFTKGANPWVFAADERHFEQFAGDAERAALTEMSHEAFAALLGHWEADNA